MTDHDFAREFEQAEREARAAAIGEAARIAAKWFGDGEWDRGSEMVREIRALAAAPAPQAPPGSAMERDTFDFLCHKYVQRADERQRTMGLQYTEAETHDLAKEISSFFARAIKQAGCEVRLQMLVDTTPLREAIAREARAAAMEEAARVCDDDAHTNTPDDRRGEIAGQYIRYAAYQAQRSAKRIRALAAAQREPVIHTCPKCGASGAAFNCSEPGCPVNGGAAYGKTVP